jgi:EVE domain
MSGLSLGCLGPKMRTWIFQGNPDRYDIDGYLASRPAELLWLVSRYGSDVAVGDRVYLWRNQGAGGGVAGIVAEGIVTASPSLRNQDPDSLKFWREPDERNNAPQMRAGMRLIKVARRTKQNDLRSCRSSNFSPSTERRILSGSIVPRGEALAPTSMIAIP